jgi:hypothetical protein
MELIYYWHHHGLAWIEDDSIYNGINNALKQKNWASFQKYHRDYHKELPEYAVLYIGNRPIRHIKLNKITFKLITHFEDECG